MERWHVGLEFLKEEFIYDSYEHYKGVVAGMKLIEPGCELIDLKNGSISGLRVSDVRFWIKMENEHELGYEILTRVYSGSYEHYKSVGAGPIKNFFEQSIAAIKGYIGGSGG
ncbi:hypothetical protein Tco_0972236 [Tanacetum coccineum]